MLTLVLEIFDKSREFVRLFVVWCDCVKLEVS